MFRNYFRTAWRNLLNNKVFSAINIGGLAIGIAACLVILQYVGFETSYDRFHVNSDNIYRVTKQFYQEGVLADHSAMTYTANAPAMKAAFPEVIGATTVSYVYGSAVMSYENVKFNEEAVLFADSAFLSVFTFPLLKGEKNILKEPHVAFLTQSTARKYFGKADPLGKVIWLNKEQYYTVKGILKDVPANSHIKFDFVLSAKYDRNWNNYDYYTYLQLAPGTNVKALEAKFGTFVKNNGMDSVETKFKLQALNDIHLHSNIRNEIEVNGNVRSVYFLLTIAAFILAIAWVNYINLSTAKANKRAREIGVRKVVGAGKGQLVKQFLTESFMINIIAAVLAALLLVFVLPYYKQLTGRPLWVGGKAAYWFVFIAVFLLGAFLSGLYPALVLSSFKPVFVLKGVSKSPGGQLMRKTLVTIQFAASVILLIGTFTVFHQLQYMRSQDLGMNMEQVLVVIGPKTTDNSKIKAFRNEMSRQKDVSGVCVSSNVPGKEIWSANPALRLGQEEKEGVNVKRIILDQEFIRTFKIPLIAGRNVSENGTADIRDAVMLNEAACRALGFRNPEAAINERIVTQGDTLNVVGVLKNYHQVSLQKNIEPIVFTMGGSYNNFFSMKINTRNLDNIMRSVKTTYAGFFPDDPIEFFFLDDFFNRQYQADQQLGSIFLCFACLAILIACLGLFGLASFTITQRTKEIGVRKVLGASVGNIVLLLSGEFLKLVLISFVIALPLAAYVMHLWLQDFAYRVTLAWWIFVLSGGIALLIAALTVSFQAVKSALANPVNSLKTE